MPAVTQFEIEKMYNGEYWVNRYFLSTTIGDSAAAATAILAAERAVTDSRVTFTKMTLRTTAELDYIYATTVINAAGLANNSGADMLPLFAVVRVDFTVTAGRPSRKYLRGLLIEPATLAFDIIPQYITAFQTGYADAIEGVAGLCDPQGDAIVSGVVYPKVAMRQLRRGSKKKVTPSSPIPV